MHTFIAEYKVSLIIVLGMAVLMIVPFIFSGTTGEADSMRMTLGIYRALDHGEHFSGYNYEISYGYYLMIEMFKPWIAASRSILIPLMNQINAIFSILALIPFFLLVERLWSRNVAVVASIFLLFSPAWWNTSLYGHPVITSLCFFYLALLVLLEFKPERKVLNAACGTVLLGLSLSFRLDTVLLFPMVLGILWAKDRSFKSSLVTFLIICVSAVLLTKAGFWLVSGKAVLGAGGGDSSIFERLLKWHNLERLMGNLVNGITIAVFAFGPVFVAILSLGLVLALKNREWFNLFFIYMVVVITVFFWLPNPSPARHFVMICPLVALGGAICAQTVLERFLGRRNLPVLGLAVLIGALSILQGEAMFPLAQAHYPWKSGAQNHSYRVPIRSMFLNKIYSQQTFLDSAEFGDFLLGETVGTEPILAFTTSALSALVRMSERQPDISYASFPEVANFGNILVIDTGTRRIFLTDTTKITPADLVATGTPFAQCDLMIDPRSVFSDAAVGR